MIFLKQKGMTTYETIRNVIFKGMKDDQLLIKLYYNLLVEIHYLILMKWHC